MCMCFIKIKQIIYECCFFVYNLLKIVALRLFVLHKNNILAFGRFIEGQSLNSLGCMINNGLGIVNFLSVLTKPRG
ncbi:MAG: hypothetical protein EBW25_03915, partial [Actinobacteria bacterium]|nr:hypothetical protein [Actinomycetota bacterium]